MQICGSLTLERNLAQLDLEELNTQRGYGPQVGVERFLHHHIKKYEG